MMTTCSCILAVDFAAFPRRFAKAETFGSGLVSSKISRFFVLSIIFLPFLLTSQRSCTCPDNISKTLIAGCHGVATVLSSVEVTQRYKRSKFKPS
eukprot:4664406-Pyramimonas_sp.AAC.1